MYFHLAVAYSTNVTLEPAYPIEGDTADFRCLVQLKSSVTGGFLKWYLNGFIIRGGPFSNTKLRVQEEQQQDGLKYWSHLRIKDLKWTNSGR